MALLKEQRKQPRSLKSLCKETILQQLCARTQVLSSVSSKIEIHHRVHGSWKQIILPLPSQPHSQAPTKQLGKGAEASTSKSRPLYFPTHFNNLPLPMQLKAFLQLSGLDAARKTIDLVVV